MNLDILKVLFLLSNITICRAHTASACTFYTVQLGDTCFSLGVSQSLNTHIKCHSLRPGQRVCLFINNNVCGPNSFLHTIQYGQTCFSIGIDQDMYPDLNCNNLKPGDQVCLSRIHRLLKYSPRNGRLLFPGCTAKRYYRVNKGDTCFLISRLFGYSYSHLYALNMWNLNCNNLQIGQVICV